MAFNHQLVDRFTSDLNELELTQLKHQGEPERFKCVVMKKFRDPLTRQVSESLNIANGMNTVELCNSRAEYHQPQIVRVSREVQRGL